MLTGVNVTVGLTEYQRLYHKPLKDSADSNNINAKGDSFKQIVGIVKENLKLFTIKGKKRKKSGNDTHTHARAHSHTHTHRSLLCR